MKHSLWVWIAVQRQDRFASAASYSPSLAIVKTLTIPNDPKALVNHQNGDNCYNPRYGLLANPAFRHIPKNRQAFGKL